MKNQNKNKFTGLAILIFLVFVLYLFNKNDPTNLNQDSTDQANKTNTTYDVTKKTSSNKNSNNHAANSFAQNRIPASTNAAPSNPIPNSETLKLLEMLDINYQTDHKSVQEDIWYVSYKYVLIPNSEYKESMGKVKTKTDLFVVVEATGSLGDDYPPVVVSYSNGSIVQLTGDISIKYQAQGQNTRRYLATNFKDDRILDEAKLREINLLYLILKKKGDILNAYDQLAPQVGNFEIARVELKEKRLNKLY